MIEGDWKIKRLKTVQKAALGALSRRRLAAKFSEELFSALALLRFST